MGKPKVAIKYLKNVLDIETDMSAEIKNFELSSTYINICTIYSEMGRHDIALSYIRKAIKFLEEDFEERLHAMDDKEKK
jgi:tetratricopeptide (TPR) repeat protein